MVSTVLPVATSQTLAVPSSSPAVMIDLPPGANSASFVKPVEFIKIYDILPAPRRKERTAMLRYASEREKANQILNLTSLTVEEFEQLVEPFEQAFVHHMSQWTMEGKLRTARAYTAYVNSPLPT